MFVLAAPCCFTGFLGLTEPFTLIIRNTLCKLPKKNVNYWWVWYTGLSGLLHLHVLNIYFVIQSPLVWSSVVTLHWFPPGEYRSPYRDVKCVKEEMWGQKMSLLSWCFDSCRGVHPWDMINQFVPCHLVSRLHQNKVACVCLCRPRSLPLLAASDIIADLERCTQLKWSAYQSWLLPLSVNTFAPTLRTIYPVVKLDPRSNSLSW